MISTSFNFLIFFPLLTIIYWVTPHKWKLLLLLATSYFFYININPSFLFILLSVTCCTWIFTNLMAKAPESGKRKYLVSNIILILLPLFFFKYYSDINNGILHLLESHHVRWPLPSIKLLLPVGISFYTFMAIGYTIDVYNEDAEVEKNPAILALFLSFFPLILSGPIERAKNMLPQFRAHKTLQALHLTQGLKLMLWGYFMKLVVADRVGIYVDSVFNNIHQHNGTTLLLASIFYPFQVYADLGGYSLIAIGTAKILGFNVMQNFKRPFFARSMSDLWHRWHISLISWLTDYIYLPLSFTLRKYKLRGIVVALMITFLISGIWHGAKLTFIFWGLIQGTYLSIEAITNHKRDLFEKNHNLHQKVWFIAFEVCITFILFSISQVFARVTYVSDAITVLAKIITNTGKLYIESPSVIIFCLFGIVMLLLKDFTDEYFPNRFLLFENRNVVIRFLSYSAVVILILLIGVFDGSQFIYFQF